MSPHSIDAVTVPTSLSTRKAVQCSTLSCIVNCPKLKCERDSSTSVRAYTFPIGSGASRSCRAHVLYTISPKKYDPNLNYLRAFNTAAFSASLHFKLAISMSVIQLCRSRGEVARSVILSPPRGYATDSWKETSSATHARKCKCEKVQIGSFAHLDGAGPRPRGFLTAVSAI